MTLPEILRELAQKGAFLHPAVSFEKRALAIGDLADQGFLVPKDYQELWGLCDGLDYNGIFLFGAQGLPAEGGHGAFYGIGLQNSMRAGQLPEGALLVGKTPDNLWIAYDGKSGKYSLIDAVSKDEFAEFTGIFELIEILASGRDLF